MSKILEEIETRCEEKQDYTLYNCFVEFIYKTIIYSIMASNNTEKFVKDLLADNFYGSFIFDEMFFSVLSYIISHFKENGLLNSKFKDSLHRLMNLYRFTSGADIERCNELIRIINSSSDENSELFVIEEATNRFRVPFKDRRYVFDYNCLYSSMKYDLAFINALLLDDDEYIYGSYIHDDYKVVSLFVILYDLPELSEIDSFVLFADKILKKYSMNLESFFNIVNANFFVQAKILRMRLKKWNKM